jgi:hypothetical protein
VGFHLPHSSFWLLASGFRIDTDTDTDTDSDGDGDSDTNPEIQQGSPLSTKQAWPE